MAEIKFNLLVVDLTAEKTQVVDVTGDVKKYLGARGLANKLMWDNMPQGADPLGPENILHIGVGPLTGLVGCKTILSFKSPLTGWAGRSTCSGYVGDEIVRAGYNAGILLKGKASKPVYVMVYNDKVELRPASDLWGKWRQETEVTLRETLLKETGQIFGVLSIGPAGENLVRYANVVTDSVHSASKWGCGAVMGSKNVKAVAVKGTKTPAYADHKAVWELFRRYATHPETALRKLGESRYGHTTSMPNLLRYAAEGIKNNHLSYDKVVERSNALEHQLKYQVWVAGCPGCAAACFVPFFKNSDHGAFSGEFRHDNTGNFNANIMVGYEEMAEMNHLLNELGMDGEELGGLVAWAMDMYENGIITKDDLGGIDLVWGDIKATIELVKNVAYRKTKVGNALADGYKRAFQVFGDKSIPLAWQFHGCSGGTYDARNRDLGRGLEYATSHNGARMGAGLGPALTEAATICQFAEPPFNTIWGSEAEFTRAFLNAVCGWNLTVDDVKTIQLRNYYFNRAVSFREGYHPAKDDGLPERCFTEPIKDKYGKQWVWTKEEYETAVKKYRTDTLKLTADGLLPRDGLVKVGLDFVIPLLEPMKAIG